MRLDLYPFEKENDDGMLTRLAEECAEVIVIISKIKRFGLGNFHPDHSHMKNVDALFEEINDVVMCVDELRKRREMISYQVSERKE